MADVDVAAVQRALVESGAMLTFLNDGNPGDAEGAPAVQDEHDPAVQAGTVACRCSASHGFFGSYDARPAEPLDRAEAALWADALADVRGGASDVPDARWHAAS